MPRRKPSANSENAREQTTRHGQVRPVVRVWLAQHGKACRNSDNATNNKTKVKTKNVVDIHITLTREALAKVDKQEMIEAKFEFTRPEHPAPVKPIVREASPAPLRFSLANLLPVGV